EPDVGLTRLETVRVSRASADQRRGRAGRTEPGVCYRLWDEPQTASLQAANLPEILAADLSGFVLDLAHWGVADPAALAFLDPPHRLEGLRHDRSPRAREGMAMARRWAEIAGANAGALGVQNDRRAPSARERQRVEGRAGRGELSTGVLLALAYPDRIARSRG